MDSGEMAVRLSMMEPGTLQWPGDRQTGGQEKQTGGRGAGLSGAGDRMSVRSDLSVQEASSWTESERGLKRKGQRRGEEPAGGRAGLPGEGEEPAGGRAGLPGEGEEPVGGRAGLPGEGEELKQDREAAENHLPEKAAQVFSPAVVPSPSIPRHSDAFWEMQSEKSPFVDHKQQVYQYEWDQDDPPTKCGQGCYNRDTLKVGVSLMTSALLFPFLVWGGFVFLPFDAPLMSSAPLRLVYTLRCSVFAATPIVLGWLVLAVSRLRAGAVRPLFDDDMKEAELREVTVHQRFISDSASLFMIYFMQLVVMVMYLSQEQLKLVPLLTILFAFGRLVYWVAAAFGSSVRGFGFGLSFLPSVAMMAANFYFIFAVEAAGSIFSPGPQEEALTPASRQRFWG